MIKRNIILQTFSGGPCKKWGLTGFDAAHGIQSAHCANLGFNNFRKSAYGCTSSSPKSPNKLGGEL
jgi:hypothetical protein